MRCEVDDEQSLPVQRGTRFFADGGLCDRFERAGDPLIQFASILDYVSDAVPGWTRDAVTKRFLFSARNGGFGLHGRRRTIAELIDLDGAGSYVRAHYSLRPSFIRAEAAPLLMRARRSVWEQWIAAQGWPVPGEFMSSRKAAPAAVHHADEADTQEPAAITIMRWLGLTGEGVTVTPVPPVPRLEATPQSLAERAWPAPGEPRASGIEAAAEKPAAAAPAPRHDAVEAAVRKFVEEYIAGANAAGRRPTGLGLEQSADAKPGSKAKRQKEFKDQMGDAAPKQGGRGKSAQNIKK